MPSPQHTSDEDSEVRANAGDATSEPGAPQPVRVLWRGLVFLGLCAFFTVSAMVSRGLAGGFGFDAWPITLAAGGALLSGLLLAPVAGLVELPEAIFDHWLPERRARRGGCPNCGYSALHSPVHECPECGAVLEVPAPYTAGWRTLRRGVAIALPAWLLGCAIGLTLVLLDEHAFTVEFNNARAQQPDIASYTRPRTWPASFALLKWTPADGLIGPPPFSSPKERRKSS